MLYTRAKTINKIGRKPMQVWDIKGKMLTLEEPLKNKWPNLLLWINTSPKLKKQLPQVPQTLTKV